MKARPSGNASPAHFRARKDTLDVNGTVTQRYLSRLRHIPVGRAHRHRRVAVLVAGRHVHIVAEDGALLRELTLDPQRDYQPLGNPCGRPRFGHHDVRQVATIT